MFSLEKIKSVAVLLVGIVCSFSWTIFAQKNQQLATLNVIIILVDALRRDHLGIYGYYRDTTPNIDNFSQEAVVFNKAITPAPWTKPAVASLPRNRTG